MRLNPRTTATEKPQHNCSELKVVCGWNVKNAQHTDITRAIKENYKALPGVRYMSAFALMLMNVHACVLGAESATGRSSTVCMSAAQPWLHCSQKSNQVIGRGGGGGALVPSPNGCRRSDNKQHVMQSDSFHWTQSILFINIIYNIQNMQ